MRRRAKNAEKTGDKATAIQKYQEAANYSSALFKLGISTEDKKMREFIKKAEQLKKAN
jgi:23S rRNA maturation mini-RNase III